MDLDTEETRREHMIRLGKVGLAGLFTFGLIHLYGREELIKDLSQKDPNQLIAGLDFTAYNMVNTFRYKGKDINIENWRLVTTQRGVFVVSEARSLVFPADVSDWCEDLHSSALGFKPFYGQVSEAIPKVMGVTPESIAKAYERFNEAAFSKISESLTTSNRKIILSMGNDVGNYSILKYKDRCIKCDIDVVDYLIERMCNQIAEMEKNRQTGNYMIEIENGDMVGRKLDYLSKERRKEYGAEFKTVFSLKEGEFLKKDGSWNINKFSEYWNRDIVDCVILEDISSSKESLERNIEKIKEIIGKRKMLVIRLVCGFKRKTNNPVNDLKDRMSIVLKSEANGYLLNDGDGSWLFSGKNNPIAWNEMERMVEFNHKKLFGLV
jgi:hypothetical protein